MLCIPLYPLESGRFAKVDAKDFGRLADGHWHYMNGYAVRSVPGGGTAFMHREIMGLTADERVDHVNGDGLDNRRSNLRRATPQQNTHNKRKHKPTSSHFKGVSCPIESRSRRSPWRANIRFNGKTHCLGYFGTEKEAAEAYDAAARQNFGAFACVNFPKDGEQSAIAYATADGR